MTEAQGPPQSLGRAARTVAVIAGWYCISAVVILTSKWVLSRAGGSGDGRVLFPFPLLITTCSNTITTAWAWAVTRPSRLRVPALTGAQVLRFVLPIGVVTAFDIGCSNVALKLLSVSFGTIIKGSAPVFTMLWALAFGLERFSPRVAASLVVISGGVALATLGEGSDFLLAGFLLQLAATSLAGLRWALTQALLGTGADRVPPLAVVLYTSPATAAFILPFALALEGRPALAHLATLSPDDVLLLTALVLAIGTLVFVLLSAEYWVVQDTSSLALSVAAVFKELLTIGGGIIFFHEVMTPLNVVGFVTCQVGIACYVRLRMQKPKHVETDAEVVAPLAPDLEDPFSDVMVSPIPQLSRPRFETKP